MLQKKLIIQNIFFNWAGFFTTAVIGFFLSPFLVHRLGDTGYGFWTLVVSLTGYFGVLDVGVRSAVGRFVSRYLALKDEMSINRIINTALVALTGGGIIALLVSIVLATFLPKIFQINPEHLFTGRILIVLVGASIITSLILSVFNSVLTSLERYEITNGITIIVTLLRAFLIVVFLNLGFGLLSLGIITFVTNLIENLIRMRLAFSLLPFLRLNLSFIDRKTLKEIFSYGIYSFISAIAVKIVFYTDTVVIGMFMAVSAITYYAIAGNLIEYARNFIGSTIGVFYPVSAKLDAKQDLTGLQELLIKGTKFTLMLALPLGLTFIFFGKQFISLWMGAEYVSLSWIILVILMLPQFGAMSQSISASILCGMAKHKSLAHLAIGESVSNLILSIILVKKFGLVGVAWGTAIPLLLTNTIIMPIYICKKLNLNFLKYIKESFLTPALCSISFAFIAFFFTHYIKQPAWIEFIAQISFSTIIFYIFSFFLCLDDYQRKEIILKAQAIINLGRLYGERILAKVR